MSGRWLIVGGRYRVPAWMKGVCRRDLQRLVRATWLWERGRWRDAIAVWRELQGPP